MRTLRTFYTLVEVTYLGGTLPAESLQAIAAAVRGATDGEASCTVRPGPYNILVVNSTVRAPTPVEALRESSALLDRVLVDTGLFERFDVTGRTLRAGPVEQRGA